jgi:hypothetical protein
MPVDQAPARPAARPNDGAKLVKYHDYIDQKIESTRRLVKVVDLATSFVALAIGVLLFLLVVVVLEHWVVRGGLSPAARWVLFGGLAAYVAYFAYRRLWPLCVRAINPVYAAHTIEHNSPALKNSLINLLLFRQRRSDISDAVYRTLEEQAAQGLTRVQVDASVDQSQLIRLGYVLIVVAAVAGLYKVFSPKDPLVAAERVLMPWANVVPASRVSITGITPGDATISRGEFVDVSADIRGLSEDDSVVLRFTTDDGQVVGRAVPMRLGRDGLRFSGRLADEPDASMTAGLTRDVTYWLEAGDARSLNYAITVVPAASILVERVDYDYPAYTGYIDRSVDGVGDIRAIEGTRVTVHARANGAIREANVDFNADGRRDLTMTTADTKAHASFPLELRDDRQTPRHASYVLRFTNDEGRANIDPVKHAINVERDIDPEAEIRLPQEQSRDARVDENVAIEVDARDPDFALGAVRLMGEAGGREAVSEILLKTEQRGKFTGRFVLKPSAHGLKAGDVLEYWVEADDNRAPQPNTIATARKVLRIIAPKQDQQPQPNKDDRQQPQQGEQRQQDNQQPQDSQQNDGNQGGGQGNQGGEQQKNPQGGEGQQANDQQGQQDKIDGQGQGEGQGQGNEPRQGEAGEGRQGEGETGRGGESKGEARDSAESKPGDKSQGGKEAQGGASSGRDQEGQQDSDSEQTGAGAAGGESSKDGPQPDGTRSDTTQGEKSNARDQQAGEGRDGQERQAQDKSPVSSEGDNDAEAFDRIQKHLEEKGELERDAASDGEQGAERGEEGESGRGGESKDVAREAANGEENRQTEGKDGQQQGQKSEDKGQGGGAQTRGDDVGHKQEPKNGEGQEEKSPGGEQTSSKGEAGDGNEQKSQGAPNSKEGMKPKDKPEQAPSQGEKTNQQEPPAGANSKKESDSHGDEGGDKAGGGEEGGGQKAPREGTGSEGANESADEGAGQSGEKGKGENSSEGGQDAKADKPTGESDGKTKGKGSEKGERQGDKETGRQEEGETGSGGESQDRKGNKDGGDNKSTGSAAGGGGEPGGGVNQQPSITGEAPDGDAANLEYARKQTDLVLEKLADQLGRKKVDDKLLKELGWTEAELKRFVARWQQRKAAAAQNDEAGDAAKRELDDALRSLGLKRGELRQNAVQEDTLRDLREGYRGPVPPQYKERLRAYNQGVSRARASEK